MTFIIVVTLLAAGIALIAFAAVVIGVRGADRRMSLRSRSAASVADAIARRVLGVYVRQPEISASRETESACHDRVRR
jgi:hypothetical protein